MRTLTDADKATLRAMFEYALEHMDGDPDAGSTGAETEDGFLVLVSRDPARTAFLSLAAQEYASVMAEVQDRAVAGMAAVGEG